MDWYPKMTQFVQTVLFMSAPVDHENDHLDMYLHTYNYYDSPPTRFLCVQFRWHRSHLEGRGQTTKTAADRNWGTEKQQSEADQHQGDDQHQNVD